MYQFSASHPDDLHTLCSQSEDGSQLMVVYITDREQESLGRFRPETREMLLREYTACIREGLPDGGDALYRRLKDCMALSPQRAKLMMGSLKKLFTHHLVLIEGMSPVGTNLVCEEVVHGKWIIRSGNLEIGEIIQFKDDDSHDQNTGNEGNDGHDKDTGNEAYEEHDQNTMNEGNEGYDLNAGNEGNEGYDLNAGNEGNGDNDQNTGNKGYDETNVSGEEKEPEETHGEDGKMQLHWWNTSTPVVIVLLLLLAVVSFFVTMLLTGRISLGVS